MTVHTKTPANPSYLRNRLSCYVSMAAQPITRRRMMRATRALADITKNHPEFASNEEIRGLILKYGLVEHRISPYEALQRAIDDATLDYVILRRKVDRESDGPSDIFDHPDYNKLQTARETMVRYSTYAIQYDIIERQQKISEARIALLGHALQATLRQLKIPEDAIKQAPALLIENLHEADKKIDMHRATALVEILHDDAEVVIEPLDDD